MQWLRWLARKLSMDNQSLFLIEGLQPSWLPGKAARQLYMLLSGLITGLAGGLMMWLLWRILRLTLPELPSPTSAWLARLLGTAQAATEPITILIGNLFLGLLLGVILYVLFERRARRITAAGDIRRLRRVQTFLVGSASGLATFLFVLIFAEPLLALAWGVAEGFMYGAAARYLFGWSYQTEVRPVEALGWSWRHAAIGTGIGLGLALVAEAIESALYGYNGMVRTVSTLALGGFILGGLRGRSAEISSTPNQAVWLSLRNALIAAVVLSLPLMVLTLFIRDPLYALHVGLLAALIAASLMGVGMALKHFLLRAIFRAQGKIPWRYARFLDYATQLTLLRKVGGGYIFMHGLLQAHLAGVQEA